LRQQCSTHRLNLVVVYGIRRERRSLAGEITSVIYDADNARTTSAFHQHLDGTIGQLKHLQQISDTANAVEILRRRLVLGRKLLRHKQDTLARLHCDFQRLNGFWPAYKKGDNHVREDNNITQRQ
jgi:hypothetical protein